MSQATSPQRSRKSVRRFLECLHAGLGSVKPALMLLGGTLVISNAAIAQQITPLQPLVQVAKPTTGSQVRLQVYDVPSDLVGPIGARLQLQYGQMQDVSVTTEPRTGQLMVMAPELVHRNIAGQLQTLMASVRTSPQASDKGMSVASYQQQTYHLRNLSWREMEDSLTRLGGPKLTVTTERNGEVAVFRLPNATGMQDVLQVDRRTNQVSVLGGGLTSSGWMQVMHSLDEGQVDRQRTTHVIPLSPAEPRRVKRAFQLVKATLPQDNQTTGAVNLNQQGNPTTQRPPS